MAVKVLMTWDIAGERDQEYFEFIIGEFIPGAVDVRSAWSGDVLGLQVTAMGQEVNARIDVRDAFVRSVTCAAPSVSNCAN